MTIENQSYQLGNIVGEFSSQWMDYVYDDQGRTLIHLRAPNGYDARLHYNEFGQQVRHECDASKYTIAMEYSTEAPKNYFPSYTEHSYGVCTIRIYKKNRAGKFNEVFFLSNDPGYDRKIKGKKPKNLLHVPNEKLLCKYNLKNN